MKRILFLTAAFCLLAISAFAQNKADFSGNWELDTINSKLDERMRVESMTMKVDQTENEITVGTFTKRAMRADGSGGMNNGVTPTALTYSLVEGQALKGETIGGDVNGGKIAETTVLKASLEADGKLNLSSVRKINTQMGEMTINVRETWELADGGNTLKVSRTMESPRGTQSSELVFTKKEDEKAVSSTRDASSTKPTPKTVSGGVLNSKANPLVKPEYPPAARAVNASGTVNVQVTVDEQGKVISASAVSGHPLLRAASEEAARATTFTPTQLSGVPVKVTGIIVYNFVP